MTFPNVLVAGRVLAGLINLENHACPRVVRAELSDEQILELTYITSMYLMHGIMSRALRTEFDDRDEPIVEVPGEHESLAVR